MEPGSQPPAITPVRVLRLLPLKDRMSGGHTAFNCFQTYSEQPVLYGRVCNPPILSQTMFDHPSQSTPDNSTQPKSEKIKRVLPADAGRTLGLLSKPGLVSGFRPGNVHRRIHRGHQGLDRVRLGHVRLGRRRVHRQSRPRPVGIRN